ncbi:MAG: polysaccharide biosynthesis tyrosine autokinase [Verrucomicrobia bacterium]|nr:polysaccharide biosynthesis tyrosine autokinase [Cytophagales bacterium]
MSASNGKSLVQDEESHDLYRNRENDDSAEDILSELDLSRVGIIFRKNILLLIGILFFCLLIGYLYLRYTKPVYEASSSLRLAIERKAAILSIGGMSEEPGTANLQGEIELIRSPLIYKEVIKHADLAVSYYVHGKILDEERYKNTSFLVDFEIYNELMYDVPFDVEIINAQTFRLSYMVGKNMVEGVHTFNQVIKTGDFSFVVKLNKPFSVDLVKIPFYFKINSENALYQYISSNLRVEILNPNAGIISIYFKDYHPFKCRDIVNSIDTVYLQKTLEQKSKSNTQKKAFLEEQMSIVEDSLAAYENQLQYFTVREKTTDVNADVSKAIDKIDKLAEDKALLSLQVSQLLSLEKMVEKSTNLNFTLPLLNETPQIVVAVNQLSKLQQELEMMKGSIKPTTFAFQTKEKEVSIAKNNLTFLLKQHIFLLQEKLSQLNRKIGNLESSFSALPAKSSQYAQLRRFAGLYEKFYLQMMDRKAEIGIAEAGTTPDFVVLSQAYIPKEPISPKKLIIYAICGAVGLIICLLIIGLKYLFYNTLSHQRDLERMTDVPILGIIPQYLSEKMPVSRLVIDKYPKSSISEAFRSIRTNMEFVAAAKKKKRIISVTSTVSGEGKTFISMNLAGVISLSGTKVVLLDLDMRKPKLHLAMEATNEKGISTILIGKYRWQDCICKTDIATLDFITAGPTPPNPSELILRTEFDELLQSLQESYDVIVIDTPPVGLVTDGILVMRKADLPVYVFRADYSKRSFVKNINSLVDNQQFKKLTIILNAFRGGNTYGYNYGYGYYEDEKPATFMGKLLRR